MIKNYLKITFRSLMKNKLFVIINVLGMGIALSCCIVAYLNWDFNEQFDTHHARAESTYRLNFIRITNGNPIKNGSSPLPMAETLRGSVPAIDMITRVYPTGGDFKIGDELFRAGITGVDPDFFNMFSFEFADGNPAEIEDRSRIFISEQLVENHFPDQNPMGKILTYVSGGEKIDFIVAGVFKRQPFNSSFLMDAYVHIETALKLENLDENNWAYFTTTFLTVSNPDDVPEVERQMAEYVEIQNRAKEDYKVHEYYLDPFVGMAVRDEQEGVWNSWFHGSLPVAAAIAPGIMAILILLIACFNFTNTTIAIANRRLKEIGIRKVMGSRRKQLIAQFLGENILLTFFALVVGLLLSEILVPAYSQLWPFLEIELSYTENLGFLAFLVLLLVFTGVLSGSYPAFYISGFQPSSILRGTLKFGGTSRFTRVLLTLQYGISLIAIICGFIFSQNAEYQDQYDMGYETEKVVFAYIEDEDGYNAMKNELSESSMINAISGSAHAVTSSWYTDPIKYEGTEMDVVLMDIGDNYLNTIGATIIDGREFIEDSQTDVEQSVIINEELARQLGWDKSVGKQILLRDTLQMYVVGVVRDIYIDGALWEPLRPLMMRYIRPDRYRFISVQADLPNINEVHALMESKWKVVFPDKLSGVRYLSEEKADQALVNQNIKTMFVFLGGVAAILSVIGLFSLVSLNIIKRMKEIGVRKVLGASLPHIVSIIYRQFLILLGFAAIIGSVAGYYMADLLMGSIWTYYLPIGALPFILSTILMFGISILTVSGKVIKAAIANPAYTLRDE